MIQETKANNQETENIKKIEIMKGKQYRQQERLDHGLGDEGAKGSRGSKGLRLARGLLSSLGDVGWISEDLEGCEEYKCVCLLIIFFLLTYSHLFSGSSLFSFSFFFLYIYLQNDHIRDIPCI